MVFLPTDADDAAKAEHRIAELAAEEGLRVLGWRDVPVEPGSLGASALRAMPRLRQVVVVPTATGGRTGTAGPDALAVDRLTFCLRKRVEHEVPGVYVVSLSARTIVYKGMLTPLQLDRLLPRPVRRALRERARPRPLALLDQHLPVVAAGPPLPVPGPQRRDQHAAGQPELDAGPRGAARERPHSPATSSGSSPCATPRAATRPPSTRCSSSCTSVGGACPTPCS